MEQITKEQLLAKAKETYKEGMEVICLHSGTKKTIGKYKPHSFADNNDIWIGSKPSLSIKIYDSLRGGKWAEIISTQRQHDGYIVIYTELDMKQYAMECVANFLSNDKNEIEMKLTEIIIDRNDKQFLKFREKHYLEQAKELEKQQHEKTWFDSTMQFANESEMINKKYFDDYYTETFNQ